MFEKRNGRPSIARQIEIENKIKEYFLQKLDAKIVAGLTGYNVKTVRKHFNLLNEEIQNSTKQQFFEKVKEANALAIMRFDLQINSLQNLKNMACERFNQKKGGYALTKDDREVIKLILLLEKMISDLTLAKLDVGNSPTADISLDAKVEELKKKYGETFK